MHGKWVPVLFTAASLGAGMISLISLFHGRLLPAVISVVISAMLDVTGGFIAERRQLSSPFAKELRSLCEIISFGAAPSFIVYISALQEFRIGGILLMSLFSICGALRLARFNVTPSLCRHHIGLPITGAGCVLAVFSLWSEAPYLQEMTIGLILLLSFLMVGRFKIPAISRSMRGTDSENMSS